MARTLMRITVLSAAALAIAAGVSGCTKPAPGVSVFSGSQSVHSQALCWAGTGASIDASACAADMLSGAASGGSAAVVPVGEGNVIGISVDTAVAEAGWYPVIGGQALSEATHSTYMRFTYPQLKPVPADGLPMMVVAGSNDQMRGLWAFTLAPANS